MRFLKFIGRTWPYVLLYLFFSTSINSINNTFRADSLHKATANSTNQARHFISMKKKQAASNYALFISPTKNTHPYK